MQKQKVKIINSILIIIVLLNITSIVYYVFFEYQNFFHSDSAVKNLLAQEIFETGKYFPKDWNYVNGDLWVLFGHIFIIPLLFFFENSFTLHSISGLISSSLIIFTTYILASMLSQNLTLRILSLALITSGISPYVVESLYGQAAYGTIYYLLSFVIIFSIKYLLDNNKRWIWSFLLFFTLVLIFWGNPSRALIMCGIPFSFAIVFLLISEFKQLAYVISIEIKKLLLLYGIFIFSMITGIILYKYSMNLTNNIQGLSTPLWLPFDLILKHINLTLEGIMHIFNAIPTAKSSIKTPYALYEIIRFISGLLLIFLIIDSFKVSFKSKQKSVQFITAFVFSLLICSISIHVTTSVPNMDDPLASSRYIMVPILFSLLIFVATIVNHEFGVERKIINLVVVFVFVTSAPVSILNGESLFVGKSSSKTQYDLINFLKSKDLNYGYATFWNAGKLTILSENKVKIRQIEINDGIPNPFRWLSSNRWYIKNKSIKKSFLLLTENESKNINFNFLKEMNIDTIGTLRFGDWFIYIFDGNLADYIFGWDPAYDKELSLKLTVGTPHTAGHIIQYKNQYILRSNKNEIGLLYFGPYVSINKGKYKATFFINSLGNGSVDIGTVRVQSKKGKVIHAYQNIVNNSSQKIELMFDINEKINDLEFHVYSNGQEQIELYEISLVRIEELK